MAATRSASSSWSRTTGCPRTGSRSRDTGSSIAVRARAPITACVSTASPEPPSLPRTQPPLGRGGQVVAHMVRRRERRVVPQLLVPPVAGAHQDPLPSRAPTGGRVEALVTDHDRSLQGQVEVVRRPLEQGGAGLAARAAFVGPVGAEVDRGELDAARAERAAELRHYR